MMNFKAENFRTFDVDPPAPSLEICSKRGSPMILIKCTGEAACALTMPEKDALIERFDDQNDLLLWVMRGQYDAQVVRLTRADLETYYKKQSRKKLTRL
jgi:hypothetical protein